MRETVYEARPIGYVRSTLTDRADAPRQGWRGAPAAWVDVLERYADGLLGVGPGSEVVLVTWLHQADRDVLQVHPRHDPERAVRGVFSTRAPVRPNPIGLHPVTVLEVRGTSLRVEPLEAIDGTPVLDIKAVLGRDGEPDAP